MAAAAPVTETAAALVARLNSAYDVTHRAFEDEFWATKMGLKGATGAKLTSTKVEYENFLADPSNLAAVDGALAGAALTDDERRVLEIMRKTFKCYQIPEEVKDLKKQVTKEECVLENDVREGLKLGYEKPGGGFVQASSVLLRTMMRTSEDESERRACYEGLRTIGPHVAEQFVKVVKMRNQLAKQLGYQDFYDYKVTTAEGFGKDRLFEIMDGLEERTRPVLEATLKRLATEKGQEALKPWNLSHALAGDVTRRQDPYFPFEDAVSAWGRSFAAMGIRYRGSTMCLDLLDREGKYSNGFCHWPQCTYTKPDGTFVPSKSNFTSLATPGAVGSGSTALRTLMHEGGHAAHFANIVQPSPFFSQERAPMSVAYAENQSMFLDSLCGDAAWLGRYARDRDGKPMPWGLVEEGIRSTLPYAVLALRAMIAVPYFEKALYEMPEEELNAQSVLKLADEMEERIEGRPSPRPIMSVPHLLADESSCYYHGYVLAEMSVWQTRAHFLTKYGSIVDNPAVGKDLEEVYWRPGNGEAFLSLVEKLTGKPLSSDAWVARLQEDIEEFVPKEKAEYAAAVAAGPAIPPDAKDVDLDMRMILAHGDEVIADSEGGSFIDATREFKDWMQKREREAAAA